MPSNIGEDIAVGAMKAGTHDYILKCNLTRLVPTVKRESGGKQACVTKKGEPERLCHARMKNLNNGSGSAPRSYGPTK